MDPTSNKPTRCWKEHICVYCTTTYQYPFERPELQRPGMTPEELLALEQARAQVESDLVPCPECGHYQPDMLGARDRPTFAALAIVLFCLFLPLIFCSLSEQYRQLSIGFFLLGTSASICTSVLMSRSLNRNLEANRNLALEMQADGRLEWTPPAVVDIRSAEGDQRTTMRYCLIAGCVIFLSPVVISLLAGWPTSPNWSPELISPGDQPMMYLPMSVGLPKSVRGLCRVEGDVCIENSAQLKLDIESIKFGSPQESWNLDSLAVSGEPEVMVKPWIRLQLPNDAALANKVLKLKMMLFVRHPAQAGPGQVEEREHTVIHTTELHVGPPMASSTYQSIWWASVLLGSGLILYVAVSLFLEAHNAQQMSTGTKVVLEGDQLETETVSSNLLSILGRSK